eukprot:5327932-Pleurochrysis_carterae.AAC.2
MCVNARASAGARASARVRGCARVECARLCGRGRALSSVRGGLCAGVHVGAGGHACLLPQVRVSKRQFKRAAACARRGVCVRVRMRACE